MFFSDQYTAQSICPLPVGVLPRKNITQLILRIQQRISVSLERWVVLLLRYCHEQSQRQMAIDVRMSSARELDPNLDPLLTFGEEACAHQHCGFLQLVWTIPYLWIDVGIHTPIPTAASMVL